MTVILLYPDKKKLMHETFLFQYLFFVLIFILH